MPGLPAKSKAMSTNKRKRKQKGVPAVPELPPEVDEDDLDVSDEDLEFVQKHQQYAGFMANLDTATINKYESAKDNELAKCRYRRDTAYVQKDGLRQQLYDGRFWL